jgi:hypothetical protein
MITEQWYGDILQDIVYGPEGFAPNCSSSRQDPDKLPRFCTEDYAFTVADMKDLEQTCGQSRLWGGMHFTKSVPAGHELCAGIGEKAVEYINQVYAGSDFAGKEYFLGDERPVCAVEEAAAAAPASQGNSPAANSLANSMGATILMGMLPLFF